MVRDTKQANIFSGLFYYISRAWDTLRKHLYSWNSYKKIFFEARNPILGLHSFWGKIKDFIVHLKNVNFIGKLTGRKIMNGTMLFDPCFSIDMQQKTE
jgi:hypothetical protein